jgi:hypothetical protein
MIPKAQNLGDLTMMLGEMRCLDVHCDLHVTNGWSRGRTQDGGLT